MHVVFAHDPRFERYRYLVITPLYTTARTNEELGCVNECRH